MQDLSLVDELGHRTPCLFDRDCRVDPVLVVEVDVIDAQPGKGSVAGGPHVFGTAVDSDPASVRAALVAELGGEDDLVTPAGDSSADKHLVREGAVHVGGVQEVDTDLESPVDRCDRLLVVARPVRLAHPHAAEPDGRHLEAVPESACLHDDSSGLFAFRACSLSGARSFASGLLEDGSALKALSCPAGLRPNREPSSLR